MGSERWLSVHLHQGDAGTAACLERLRSDGFRILAASPDAAAKPLNEITIEQPTALVIGHETAGVSPAAMDLADECVVVPMRGFVESFNLSVAAAIALAHLRSQLEASGLDWHPSMDEVDRLRLEWTRLSIPNVEAIERRYLE
jgi:tRNA (guanosine-2'-O-)-methyltransferase